jgi:hypothetical protein
MQPAMLASVGVSDLALELDWLTQINHIEGQDPHVHDTLCGLFTVNASAPLGSFTFTSDGMRLLVGAEGGASGFIAIDPARPLGFRPS